MLGSATVLTRDTTIDDIPQIDRIRQAVEPWHVASIETQRRRFAAPAEAEMIRICAEIDGQVMAAANGGLNPYAGEPGMATASVRVHPEVRGQGIGTALYERIEAHLRGIGARRVHANVMDDEASMAAATRRGFVFGAIDQFIVVDPRDLPPQPAAAAGVTVMTAAQAGPDPFYQVSDTAARDEPGDVAFAGMPYADWLEHYWPTVDRDISMIALVHGRPAATTALDANYDTGRAMSIGSDALREFRGRGLVKLIKSVSLRAAAERGITAAYTANDEVNAPIRAINAWLGYRPVGALRSALKTL
jgi:GNAT superfamily N-acetyltransferase